MNNLEFLNVFNREACYASAGSVEQIKAVDNQINYNSANQTICATSG
jgi:hypothetical protein